MATAVEQVEAMRTLNEGWDGYGAAAPQRDAIDLALEFLAFLEAAHPRAAKTDSIQVSPTRTGGVLIEWEDPRQQDEIDVDPDGAVSFLHVTKASATPAHLIA